MALKAAKDYYHSESSGRFRNLEDAITKTLTSNYLNKQSKLPNHKHLLVFDLNKKGRFVCIWKGKFEDDGDQDDDGILEIEAEMILDYIENFNDLFDNDKIIEAAYFAAASPKNILRDIETLYRFKSK